MPLFSPSKRDKHSRSPTPASRHANGSTDEMTPLRSRRSGANILPMTNQDTTTQRRRPRGGGSNNFLAGGMYVERKRTRRRHPTRRSSRRKWFVPIAISCGCFVLFYHSNASLHRTGNMPVSTDPAIHFPPMEYAKVLLRERQRLRQQHKNDRLNILERLAPQFFHRNDPTITTDPPPTKLRTLANMDDQPPSSSCGSGMIEPSVTLVLQTSQERLWILRETCHRWSQAIVAVVFGSGAEDHADIQSVRDACGEKLDLIMVEPDGGDAPYPVNRLRNIGLDRVRTSHILVADIDFVPSEHLDERILQYVQDRDDRDALIVPAFQRVLDPPCSTEEDCRKHLESDGSFLPRTFDEMARCHEKKECIVFQSDNNWEGHSSTGSKQWLQQQWMEHGAPRQLRCFDSMRYEPYVVLRWCPSKDDNDNNTRPVAPYYDERFHGYGKNKIQLISHIRFLGYKFFVLPEGFLVHNPHIPSRSKRDWENSQQSNLHGQMDRLYESFLRSLYDKYYPSHQEEIVDQCPKHHDRRDGTA